MTTTYLKAIDDIFTEFKAVWDLSDSIVGYIPEVLWPGVEFNQKPENSKFWCRVGQTTVGSPQISFNSDTGRRFTTYGLFLLQLFCPKNIPNSITLGRALANSVVTGLRAKKTPNGIWIKNPMINELPNDENYYRFNVISEYEFDERG